MTLSMPAKAFETGTKPARPLLPRPARPGRAHAAGIGVTIAAHLLVAAGLLFGLEVTRAPMAARPIYVDMVKVQTKPQTRPAAPKFSLPAQVVVPPPMIEIAPPPAPSAITATPPRPPAPLPAMPAPAPVETPAWNGQAGYYAGLLAWLERFKQYPAAARAAHVEGQVFVHFVMTRDGVVQSAEIARSSGRPALDREALAMVQRAGRLPPMPAEMKGETLNAVIGPITFRLR